MNKTTVTTVVALALGLGGGYLATQQPTVAHASSKFAKKDLQNPSGYYYTNKGRYAFHWQNKKSGHKTYHYLVMSDFKAGIVYTGSISYHQISANRRTFTTTFRLLDNGGKLTSTKYKFGLYKLSNSKYRVKLYNSGSRRLVSNHGTTYAITRTTKNPFTRMFNAYTKKSLKADINKVLTERYNDGYSKVDPKSADGQKALNTGVHAGYVYVKDAFSLKG